MKMNILNLLFLCGQSLEDKLSFFVSIRQPEKFDITKYKLNILRFEEILSFTPTSIFFAPQALKKAPALEKYKDIITFNPSVIGEWRYV